jgi:hypothetical protein
MVPDAVTRSVGNRTFGIACALPYCTSSVSLATYSGANKG